MLKATLFSTEEAASLTAENIKYTECDAFGFFPATVNFTSCDYNFTAGTWTTKPEDADGSVHIECDEGDAIDITVYPFGDENHKETPICHYQIPSQTVGGVTFQNDGKGNVVATVSTGKEIETSHTGSLCGTGTENAGYEGGFTASGFNEEKEQ